MKPTIKLAAMLLPLVLMNCSKKSADKDETPPPSAAKEEPKTAPEAEAQTFAAAMTHVCDAPSSMTPPLTEIDASEKASKLAEWIEKGLSNEEVLALFESMSSMSGQDKITAMNAAVAKAGLADCEVLGVWESNAEPEAEAAEADAAP